MALSFNRVARLENKKECPTGWYGVRSCGRSIPVFVDQEYDNGGWICVMANRAGTAGMHGLPYFKAVNEVNYRSEPSENNIKNSHFPGPKIAKTTLDEVNIWIGLRFWAGLAGKQEKDKITVVQFASNTIGARLAGSHVHRWRWQFEGFDPDTYSFIGATSLGSETSKDIPPGLLTHAIAGNPLSCFDKDNDGSVINISEDNNENPWWYNETGASGNLFQGGNLREDAPAWAGSSTHTYKYSAIYIR